jgi:hypothetical protein
MLLPRAQFCIQDGALIGWGSCGRPLGELALHMGRHDIARTHLERAVSQNISFGHVPETLRSQLALARIQLAAGETRSANGLVQSVKAKAVEIGMPPLAAAAEQLVSG